MEHPAEAANTALALYKLLKEIVRDHAGEKELPKPEDFRMLLSGAVIAVSGAAATLRKDNE